MTYPQATLPTLEALYRLGIQVCDEIEKFQPDVVIGLAHSGWMPVVVAQALWAETRQSQFPPSTRTNIGLEKHTIYVARYGKSIPAFCCGECSDEAGRKGHYLAWIAEQNAWLETLRVQIESVFPSTPKRVLFVDDIFGGWRSGYAALALLEALYPKVETYVFAGHHDLTDNFVTGWLEQFVPVLAAEIPPENKTTSYKRYRSSWQEKLKPLITGTEDITPDRLDWQFISQESPAVKALAGQPIPVKIILAAPAWARTLACRYALQRLNGEIQDDAVVDPGPSEQLWPIIRLSLFPEDRLGARAWRHNGITSQDIAQVYGDSPEKLAEGLKDVGVKHEWHGHGQGQELIYFPVVSWQSWITAYPLPETPAYNRPDIPVYGFAEFLPGEIWAGAYPISSNIRTNTELFEDLLNTGINHMVNLSNPKEFPGRLSYRKALLQISQETGRQVKIKSLPLPFSLSPTRQQVAQVLDHITRSIKSGQRLYIHAGHNLEGRTPLILACLLIRRGYAADQALAEVNAFWMKTLHYLVCMPLSESQQQFVLNW